jgi:hypothetical protein
MARTSFQELKSQRLAAMGPEQRPEFKREHDACGRGVGRRGWRAEGAEPLEGGEDGGRPGPGGIEGEVPAVGVSPPAVWSTGSGWSRGWLAGAGR